MQITVTIPATPVVEPTSSYATDITTTTAVGADHKSIPLGSIQNNGNVARTLQLTATPSNCTVHSISIKSPTTGNPVLTNGNTASMLIPKGVSTEAVVILQFTPPAAGEGEKIVSAELATEWVA